MRKRSYRAGINETEPFHFITDGSNDRQILIAQRAREARLVNLPSNPNFRHLISRRIHRYVGSARGPNRRANRVSTFPGLHGIWLAAGGLAASMVETERIRIVYEMIAV
jgi:hypothetical protein